MTMTAALPLLCRFCKHAVATALLPRCTHPASLASAGTPAASPPTTAFARRRDQPCGPGARFFEPLPRFPNPKP
jgi:hypothetical protein